MSQGTGSARPLEGRRVLVTRPRAQAAELVQQLESAGADVVIAPTIRIIPPADRGPLLRAAAEAARFDWIVFASANAVDAFFQARAEAAEAVTAGAQAAGPLSTLPRVCAVGSRTAERIREHGGEVAVVPGEFKAEALVDALAAQTQLTGARVLLPRSEIGREIIAEGLRSAGALVTDVVAYRTVTEDARTGATDVRQMLADRTLDAVTFTSGSAVNAFVQMHGPGSAALLHDTVVAVIGPVTAEAAREAGIEVQVQPAAYTAAAMVDALGEYFGGREGNRDR